MYLYMHRRALRKRISLLERDAFLQWALSNPLYQKLHAEWLEAGCPMVRVPTVDRIDHREGYVLHNMQFLTHQANVAKGNTETGRQGHAPSRSRAIKLTRGIQAYVFSSGKEASVFLGLARNAACDAMANGRALRGWEVCYV